MYGVTVKSHFSAAHRLRGYRGKCESLHGHNWRVEAAVASAELDKTGIVIDFQRLKEKLNEVLSLLDHKYLNELSYFKKLNPTSENITKFIYYRLNSKIKKQNVSSAPDKSWCGVKLVSVAVGETENFCATYQEE